MRILVDLHLRPVFWSRGKSYPAHGSRLNAAPPMGWEGVIGAHVDVGRGYMGA